MIVSPAGAEGLSLGNTTWEGVLDPHFNPERMNQMEARGVRAGGLKGRADRTVSINRYMATMPKKFGIIPPRLKTSSISDKSRDNPTPIATKGRIVNL